MLIPVTGQLPAWAKDSKLNETEVYSLQISKLCGLWIYYLRPTILHLQHNVDVLQRVTVFYNTLEC